MSRYYQFTFWQRWLCGFLAMIPITSLSSCMVGFAIAGELFTGFALWFGEAVVFGFLLALCPTAVMFEKPWYED